MKAQAVLDKEGKACLKGAWKVELALWEAKDQELHAKGVKGKDQPPRPKDPTWKGHKPVVDDDESSSESELGSEPEEESTGGWISGDSENDNSGALYEEEHSET